MIKSIPNPRGGKSRRAKKNAKKALSKLSQSQIRASKLGCGLKRKLKTKEASNTDFINSLNIASGLDIKNNTHRKRWKTLNEREVLECYFELDQEWSRPTILYVKEMVHLSEKQIYKWGYEKRRRLNLHTPQEKVIDMKYVTQQDDLYKKIDYDDLNKVVSNLFPEDENEEETLSEEAKIVYDHVRDQLVERSLKYDRQSDLDKLLNDRIPIQNLALEAKRNLNFAQTNSSDRKKKEDCCVSENTLQSSISNRESSKGASSLDSEEWSEGAIVEGKGVGCSIGYDISSDLAFVNQIGTEENRRCDNSKKKYEGTQPLGIPEDTSYYHDLDRTPLYANNLFPYFSSGVKDTFSSTFPANFCNNSFVSYSNPLHNFGDELKLESLNDLSGLLSWAP
ncbi:unnamed protein product [Moneuplotes crassus]|uniref:Homeobox domain-containing protein n=1 Tax=Euplotes crassus TaxID=5936 RepID=A0AAD1XFY2_EUPCR|nr:unnamed protein product [Moneuplotes crassus]